MRIFRIPHTYAIEASYVIDQVGETIRAIDGRSGSVINAGTDATTVIQSVLDIEAPKRILIKPGTYLISKTLSLGKFPLEIEGSGAGKTTLKLADNANCRMILDNTAFNYLAIKKIAFDGNRLNQSDGANRSERNLVEVSNKNHVDIENCRFLYTRHGAALDIKEGLYVRIIDNEFYSNGDPTSAFGCDHVYTQRDEWVFVKDNHFHVCTDTSLAQDNNRYSIVSDNISIGAKIGFTFFNIDDSFPSPMRVIFAHNIIRDNTLAGIFISRATGLNNLCERVSIVGNQIEAINSGEHAIEWKAGSFDGLIMNNYFNLVEGTTGVYVEGTCLHVARNHFMGYGNGIEFADGADNVIVTNNYFCHTLANAIVYTAVPPTKTVKRNIGYVTEGGGTATIANGTSSVVVNHGLAAAPSVVKLTGTHSEVANCWVTDVTDTQFTINAPAAVTADRVIYWNAEI